MMLNKINAKNNLGKIKYFTLKIITLFICIILLIYPQISSKGIKIGINYCVNMLVPSLFPFMVIVCFIVKSEIFSNPGKIISCITKFLFYLPGYTAPTILLSLIGGYPVGARGIKSLFNKKQINEEQLNRMMCFCVNSGPTFIVNVLGATIFHNISLGITIFACQIILSLTIGISLSIYARISKKQFYEKNINVSSKNLKLSETFVESVVTTSESVIEMCALIISFSTFIVLLQHLDVLSILVQNNTLNTLKPTISTFIISLLEITTGCAKASNININPMMISFCIGYGGLCAHLQICSILKNTNFNFKKFCIFRFLNALMSTLLTYYSMSITEKNTAVFSTMDTPTINLNSSTTHGSVAIIILCFYFIITTNKSIIK